MSKLVRQQPIEVYFHEHANGEITMTIKAKRIRLLPNGDCSQYNMLDVFKELSCKIDCHGFSKRPQLLLKVYCKLGQNEKKTALHRRALANVRDGIVPLH